MCVHVCVHVWLRVCVCAYLCTTEYNKSKHQHLSFNKKNDQKLLCVFSTEQGSTDTFHFMENETQNNVTNSAFLDIDKLESNMYR